MGINKLASRIAHSPASIAQGGGSLDFDSNGDATLSGGDLLLPDGSASDPSLAYSSDENTGLFRIGADNLGIATGGTKAVDIDSSQGVSLSGTLDVTGATTLSGDTTLAMAGQNYKLTSIFTNDLALQKIEGSGTAGWHFFSNSGDNSDNVELDIYGFGTAGSIADRERLRVGFMSSNTRYEIRTQSSGTGSDRPIAIRTGSNTNQMVFGLGGLVGINETANSNQTIGLTINQGANDDEILALKSSNVAHGVTTVTETDSYGFFQKFAAAEGGLFGTGLNDTGEEAIRLRGIGTGENTAKTTSALGAILLDGEKASGTGTASLGANGNLAVIRDGTTARFIFDVEGSFHADVGSTTFDRYDDLAVLEDMESILAPGQVDRRFSEVLQHDRDFFEREGLFHDIRETEPGKMRGMMNVTRMMMLHSGAIRQVGGMVLDVENRIAALEDENRALRQQVQALLN